jgi:hypothetical protein
MSELKTARERYHKFGVSPPRACHEKGVGPKPPCNRERERCRSNGVSVPRACREKGPVKATMQREIAEMTHLLLVNARRIVPVQDQHADREREGSHRWLLSFSCVLGVRCRCKVTMQRKRYRRNDVSPRTCQERGVGTGRLAIHLWSNLVIMTINSWRSTEYDGRGIYSTKR